MNRNRMSRWVIWKCSWEIHLEDHLLNNIYCRLHSGNWYQTLTHGYTTYRRIRSKSEIRLLEEHLKLAKKETK